MACSSLLERNAAIVGALRCVQRGEYGALLDEAEDVLLEVARHFGPGEARTTEILSLLRQRAPSRWDELGASALKRALWDTKMLDAAWLADLADQGGVLPRCQDVPAEAKVSLEEMEAWRLVGLGALVIS